MSGLLAGMAAGSPSGGVAAAAAPNGGGAPTRRPGSKGSGFHWSSVKYEHLVAGVSGGVASTLVLHPLDLLKVRLAVNDGQVTTRPQYAGLSNGRFARIRLVRPASILRHPVSSTLQPSRPLSARRATADCTVASCPTAGAPAVPGAL